MKSAFLHTGGLYAITAPVAGQPQRLLDDVRLALQGGCRLLQYRDKVNSKEEKRTLAQALALLCREHGAKLIINDDWQLALAVQADGVHLGQTDGEIAPARLALGADAIIGVTCHDSLTLAQQAVAAGADYIAFGAFFSSPSKPEAKPAPLDLIRAARATFNCPIVTIGGITLERAPMLWQQGADWVAVISDVFEAPDISAQASAYQREFERSREQQA